MSTTTFRPITIYNLENQRPNKRPFIRIGAGPVCMNGMRGTTSGTAFNINEAREIIDIYESTRNPRIRFADMDDITLSKEDIEDLKFFVFFMKHFEYKPNLTGVKPLS